MLSHGLRCIAFRPSFKNAFGQWDTMTLPSQSGDVVYSQKYNKQVEAKLFFGAERGRERELGENCNFEKSDYCSIFIKSISLIGKSEGPV